MKNRIALLIGLILIAGIAYAHFGLARHYFPSGKIELSPNSGTPARLSKGSEHQLIDRRTPDVAYAIVVMPKNYIPFLKQFAKSRMARNLRILPAKLDWHNGQPVVTPRQGNLKAGSGGEPLAARAVSSSSGHSNHPSSEKRVLRNAALLLLLQGALSSNMNYRPGRSHTTFSSSLHR